MLLFVRMCCYESILYKNDFVAGMKNLQAKMLITDITCMLVCHCLNIKMMIMPSECTGRKFSGLLRLQQFSFKDHNFNTFMDIFDNNLIL